jgi:hypothetical protein
MLPILIEPVWARLSAIAAEALRMTDEEATRFRANRVAKLVGLLPFLAGCDDAERSALSHLTVFVLANRGQARRAFDHAPADDADVLARLRTIADFKDGDAALIGRGMALLGLCMLAGYRRDVERDALLGEHNPVGSGVWDWDFQERSLRTSYEARASAEMDSVLTLNQALEGFWQI